MKTLEEIEKLTPEELERLAAAQPAPVPEGLQARLRAALAAQEFAAEASPRPRTPRWVPAAALAGAAAATTLLLTLPQREGKISARDLKSYLEGYYADGSYDHMVFPGMVYISFPTEYGTLYSKAELSAIYAACQEYHLPLFVDGARLGYGLMSPACDVTIQDLARLCDVFTIGGTKVGALCGEAVVFPSGKAPEHFFTMVKQHGALVAKGRLLGVQFDTLFTDGLYFKIAQGAIDLAMQVKKLFLDKGYELFLDSPTNQQFVILTPAAAKALEGKVAYEVWEHLADGRAVVRFATSWATTQEQVSQLSALLP